MAQQSILTLKDVGHSGWDFAKTAGTYTCQRFHDLKQWGQNHPKVLELLFLAALVSTISFVIFNMISLLAILIAAPFALTALDLTVGWTVLGLATPSVICGIATTIFIIRDLFKINREPNEIELQEMV